MDLHAAAADSAVSPVHSKIFMLTASLLDCGTRARTYNHATVASSHPQSSTRPHEGAQSFGRNRGLLCFPSGALDRGPLHAKQSPIRIVKDTAVRTILATIIDAHS